MKEYFQKFNNIRFLNNDYEIYNNYCFIGTTPEYKINDVYKIPNFNYIGYNRLHMLSVHFLENTLQNNENCIVITHHVPSNSLIDIKYKTIKMEPYNQWFYSNMDELIIKNRNKINCWIYGHTHTSSNIRISGIPFLCNPIGYPGENNNIDFTSFHILSEETQVSYTYLPIFKHFCINTILNIFFIKNIFKSI